MRSEVEEVTAPALQLRAGTTGFGSEGLAAAPSSDGLNFCHWLGQILRPSKDRDQTWAEPADSSHYCPLRFRVLRAEAPQRFPRCHHLAQLDRNRGLANRGSSSAHHPGLGTPAAPGSLGNPSSLGGRRLLAILGAVPMCSGQVALGVTSSALVNWEEHATWKRLS